ncbi:GNAT family N-acetyltransferase [Hymenobacter sublimis]|uniref:GNAT family N-acetyltransferase n=1 Tax=Hymenobacter sublimis TaxID=2933777 RepID=A0ABY4JC91_9BACT|nr:GNAT family N-acetyltransferase [Hymenobacter sublimis]UPL49504.1 GNAT family N-acetyltransferase [Hymenobacter sublimis]
MPTRLLRHHEIDLAAWDACVGAARQVVPYACSWWLQATAGRWDAVVEQEESSGRYLSVWPLPVKWRPWGREIHQPPFTQQLGWLTSTNAKQPLGSGGLMNLDSLLAHYSRCYTQLNEANELPPQAPLSVAFQQRHTYQLRLDSPYETLRGAYAADYRRRLRLYEAAGRPLRVTETTNVEPLLQLFQQTKGPEAGLKTRHYILMRKLVAALSLRQLLDIREVREPQTGELLASALFVRYRTKLVYLFAAASLAGKKAGAPLLLLDAVIQQHAGTSELVLDFEGGTIPSIARFFANFGAEPVPYAALSFTQRPWYLKWMR